MAFGGVTALVVVFLVRVVGLGSAAVGLVMAMRGIGGVACAVVVGRLAIRLGTARVLLVSALGAGLFGLLIPLTGPGAGVAFYLIGWAADAAGIAMGSIIAASFRQAYCRRRCSAGPPRAMRSWASAASRSARRPPVGLGTDGVRHPSARWIILAYFTLQRHHFLDSPIRSCKNLPAHPR